MDLDTQTTERIDVKFWHIAVGLTVFVFGIWLVYGNMPNMFETPKTAKIAVAQPVKPLTAPAAVTAPAATPKPAP